MSILADIQIAIGALGIPIETGVFKDEAPEKYVVVTPMADSFALHADNIPSYDVQEARISLYSQCNYMRDKNAMVRLLLAQDFSCSTTSLSAARTTKYTFSKWNTNSSGTGTSYASGATYTGRRCTVCSGYDSDVFI